MSMKIEGQFYDPNLSVSLYKCTDYEEEANQNLNASLQVRHRNFIEIYYGLYLIFYSKNGLHDLCLDQFCSIIVNYIMSSDNNYENKLTPQENMLTIPI